MKYNKGFAPLVIALIIAGFLFVGGGIYYAHYQNIHSDVANDVREVKKAEEAQGVDQVNNNVEKKGIKTQVNASAGYQVEYPSDWYVKSSDTKISSNGNYGYNAFIIQNTKDAVLPGSDFSLKTNGTYINISVDTNMNYSNYEEFIKDPKTDLPKSAKGQRLASLEMINIGGKTLQALNSFKNSKTGGSYVFIYNKKQYSINIISGSEEQFTKDKKVFEDMVSSFKFIDSEESSTETFKKQPGKVNVLTPELGIRWVMNVDLLSYNPKWLPGVDSTGGQYINQNTKTRNLIATRDTKMYKCGNSADGNIISVLSDPDTFIGNISSSNYKIRYFDITGINITAIYEQCLP